MAAPDLSAYKVAFGETPPDPVKFNALLDALQLDLNNIGNPANTTWAPGQILLPSQLKQGGASVKQGLVWNGTLWAPSSIAAITTKTGPATAVSVSNTTTETDLFTGTTGTGYLVIPGNSLTATGGITVRCGGYYTNNSGAGRTIRLKLRLGSAVGLPAFTTFTSAWDSGVSDTIGANANQRAWHAEFQFQASNALNAQGSSGEFSMSSATAPTTGLGPLLTPNSAALATPITPAVGSVDFAVDVGMVLSVIHSTASASLQMVTNYTRIEVSS